MLPSIPVGPWLNRRVCSHQKRQVICHFALEGNRVQLVREHHLESLALRIERLQRRTIDIGSGEDVLAHTSEAAIAAKRSAAAVMVALAVARAPGARYDALESACRCAERRLVDAEVCMAKIEADGVPLHDDDDASIFWATVRAWTEFALAALQAEIRAALTRSRHS